VDRTGGRSADRGELTAVATVLVVDDEPDIRELIRINLGLDGHTVVTASDGRAGLEALRASRPDVVILDVMMPGLDGFSVLEAIKAETSTVEIPVIMLTARVETIDRVRGGIEGAVRYLTKPFSVVALRRALAEVLSGEPEPAARRRAQTDALTELARLEAGRPAPPPGAARPRLTRYETADTRVSRERNGAAPSPADRYRAGLSTRQNQLLDAVVATPNLRAAAERLGVSRTYLYAGIRRIALKVGASSGPALVRALHDELDDER
jgi:DNA-binding response OmpR family regulator